MSKISDYIRAVKDHFNRIEEDRQRQTVAEFANELCKPVDSLLEQFRSAGIHKQANDVVTDAEKQTLLAHLQNAHRSDTAGTKRLTIEKVPEADPLWRAVARNDNGAELEALWQLADHVIWEQPIEPDLQRLVNLILAKSIVQGTLPSMKRGRPKNENVEQLGKEVAQAYWDMRDGGKSYADTVAWLSERVHKDERHIMRMVEAHKGLVGETIEARERNRRWTSLMREIYDKDREGSYLSLLSPKLPPELEQPDFQERDYIDHLDELIRAEAASKGLLTKNSSYLKPVTENH